jgi:hypothetical protein
MDDAAVAGEQAAVRVGDNIAERGDAVLQGHATWRVANGE